MTIRPYQPTDLPRLREIMVEAFDGVSIDKAIEDQFGLVNGHNWQWRKARHLDEDVARAADGVFVATGEDGEIVGFITTWRDGEAGIVRMLAAAQGPQSLASQKQHAIAHHALIPTRRVEAGGGVSGAHCRDHAGADTGPQADTRDVEQEIAIARKLPIHQAGDAFGVTDDIGRIEVSVDQISQIRAARDQTSHAAERGAEQHPVQAHRPDRTHLPVFCVQIRAPVDMDGSLEVAGIIEEHILVTLDNSNPGV